MGSVRSGKSVRSAKRSAGSSTRPSTAQSGATSTEGTLDEEDELDVDEVAVELVDVGEEKLREELLVQLQALTGGRKVVHLIVPGNDLGESGGVVAMAASRMPDVQVLNVGRNNLGPKGVETLLKAYPHAVDIDVSSAQLTNGAVLRTCAGRKMTHLRMYNNALGEVPEEVYDFAVSLKELNLFSNKVKALPQRLQELTSLVELNLGSNAIGPGVQKEGLSLPSLERLAMHMNKIAVLPPLDNLPNLRSLELFSNNIVSFPTITTMPHLKTILLSSNKLTELPPDCLTSSNAPALETLDLGNNLLSRFPPQLFQLPNLKKVMLQGNKLSAFPEGFETCATLEVLVLAENDISEIPSSIAKAAKLQTLVLTRNKITHLPKELVELKGLTRFMIDQNPVEKTEANRNILHAIKAVTDSRSGEFRSPSRAPTAPMQKPAA